jgi:hypothetical protein
MWLVMLNHYDLGWDVGWLEISRGFVGLPELYGLKCENLITLVIVFVLVLLYFGWFYDILVGRALVYFFLFSLLK